MSSKREHASDTYKQWNSIQWKIIEKKVSQLQSRIVKARKDNKHRKVKSLQWILTHSWTAKLLAVKRVTSNKGSKTPGVDKVKWIKPTQKIIAARSLNRRGYKAQPLRRIFIPKANGQKRPLGIPTIKDRAMQALYLMALYPVAENTADRNSYGFRPKRCCADAIEQCFITLNGRYAAKWVLEADIKGCFDNIDHQWLLHNIPTDKKILKQWLSAGIIENGFRFQTDKGTPQGGIISPLLANLTLDGLEDHIDKACGVRRKNDKKDCKGVKLKVNLIRYADDFVVTAASKTTLEQFVLPAVKAFLKKRGLKLNAVKSKITHINDGFDFLGQNIRKYGPKLLIKPSKKSVKNLKKKVFKIIKNSGCLSAEVLIHRLNPVLRGWANYHKHIVSKVVFSKIDHDIHRALWRWARRRHPDKNLKWNNEKYFKTIGNRNWVFAVDNGKNVVELLKIESIRIKRFVKIRFWANPFDTKWKPYFKNRKNRRTR